MSAISPSWLRPGQTVSVRRGRTAFGPLSFTLRTRAGGATLRWSSRLRRGTQLTVAVPLGTRSVQAPGRVGNVIRLRGRRGRIDISWRLSGPMPTYDRTIRALLRRYGRGRGAVAPRPNAAPLYSPE